jgi:hypothetical protein
VRFTALRDARFSVIRGCVTFLGVAADFFLAGFCFVSIKMHRKVNVTPFGAYLPPHQPTASIGL